MSIRVKNLILALALSMVAVFSSVCMDTAYQQKNVSGGLELNGYRFESYVKSDFLVGEDKLTIVDYANSIKNGALDLFASTVKLEQRDSKNFVLKASGDDPIVNIVPKKLFEKDCREMIMGREYGFLIDSFGTVKEKTCRRAIVMVFDIVNKTDIVHGKDNVQIIVKPLFQQEYIYVEPGDTECYVNEYNKNKTTYGNYSRKCDLAVDNSLTEAVVIPAPQYVKSEKSLRYLSVDKYMLYDFVFAGSLYNEQHANAFNSGYNMLSDDGTFFVQAGYSYNGAKLNDGVADYSETENERTQFAMGDYGLYRYAFSDSVDSEWLKEVDETKEAENNEVAHRAKFLTRQKQIDKTGSMYKEAAIRFDAIYRNAYFIGVGGFMAADFTISRTDANGENWKTRFVRRLSFKAVETRNRQNIIKAQDSTDFKLDGDFARTVKTADGDALCYVLQNGKNVFEVIPEFNAFYTISTVADKPVVANLVDEYGKVISSFEGVGYNENVKIWMKLDTDKKYYIETYYESKTASGEYIINFKFDPSEIADIR